MRTVTFVDRLAYDFPGNVCQNAICLGDADNDHEIELAVGNFNGDLAIFKGSSSSSFSSSSKSWKSCVDLGHITVVGIGDLLNLSRNVLVVISADGWCYIFDVENCDEDHYDVENEDDGSSSPFEKTTPAIASSTTNRLCSRRIRYSYKQRLPSNVKELILADVDGNGSIELLVTLTDRVIRTYRWQHTGNVNSQKIDGRLVPINKWDFAAQIGTVTLNTNNDGTPILLVSQPGGSFLQIKCRNVEKREVTPDKLEENNGEVLSDMSLDNAAHIIESMRNLNVSSEILGNFSEGKAKSEEGEEAISALYAIATLDGTVLFVRDKTVKHKIKLNHQLFCLNKLDICEDGKDELIVSSWDGHTFIISQDCQPVEFHFGESIATFKTGHYTVNGETLPVMIYVTFTNKIYVYYNINFTRGLEMKSFLESFHGSDKVSQILEDMNFDFENRQKLSELYQFLLYDVPISE